jgi:RNA polymerase sigma-70 factor (ECF subfamily)
MAPVSHGFTLARALLKVLPPASSPGDPPDPSALEAQLEGLLRECREAWPQLELPAEDFVCYLGARLEAEGELFERLAAVHAVDLYLACGCAAQVPAALQSFEQRVLPEARRALARVDASPAFLDDVQQRLRQKLLVGEAGAAGKIDAYRGAGSLVHWLRATAVREGLKVRSRQHAHEELTPELELERASADDVELEIIRGRHADDFRAAFEAAFAALSSRERNILRMHVLDSLTIDQIGAFYRTHRATAFRWVEAARRELARNLRRELSAKLRLGSADLDSLMGALRSRIDLSIRRVLATTAS